MEIVKIKHEMGPKGLAVMRVTQDEARALGGQLLDAAAWAADGNSGLYIAAGEVQYDGRPVAIRVLADGEEPGYDNMVIVQTSKRLDLEFPERPLDQSSEDYVMACVEQIVRNNLGCSAVVSLTFAIVGQMHQLSLTFRLPSAIGDAGISWYLEVLRKGLTDDSDRNIHRLDSKTVLSHVIGYSMR